MSAHGFGGVRPGRINLCAVPLSALSVEDQTLVQDALSWMAWIDQQKAQQANGSVCPKCGARLRFFEPKRRFECAECSYVEPAPVKR